MTAFSVYPSTTALSSAWMPLDGLIQEWGAFGAEQASAAPAQHAVGMAFCALARETTARSYYTAAWHASQDGDLTELEHALEELLQARQYWTDAMLSLELLLLDGNEEQTSQESLRCLLVEVMEQRARVALLIYQTQQEQLASYRRAERDQQEADETAQVRTTSTTLTHTVYDCLIFGHDWVTTGISGEKRCTACDTTGYCPRCTPHPESAAHPYYCSRHTPAESAVQL